MADGPRTSGATVHAFSEDEGQQLADLGWTPDARAIVFAQGYPMERPAGRSTRRVTSTGRCGAFGWRRSPTAPPGDWPRGRRRKSRRGATASRSFTTARCGALEVAAGAAPRRLFTTRGQVSEPHVVSRGSRTGLQCHPRRPHRHRGVPRGRRTIEYCHRPTIATSIPDGRPTACTWRGSA